MEGSRCQLGVARRVACLVEHPLQPPCCFFERTGGPIRKISKSTVLI